MVDKLTHGDYVARIEYDDGAGMHFGCVVNLSNPITFMAQQEGDLAGAMEKAIQNYLDECKAQGMEPEAPGPAPDGM